MQQLSLIDTMLSPFHAFRHSLQNDVMPYLLFYLAVLWLAAVGWKRHRMPGFLLLLMSSIIGLISAVMLMVGGLGSPNFSPERADTHTLDVAYQLALIAMILITAGIWHFVYRARFAPPEPTPQ